MDKRAIELSLNFIVILIISIIIFGFGIRFISKLSSQATELQELTISELEIYRNTFKFVKMYYL
jgi:hypothetical protein